jgi:hypothetical protein
MSAFREPKTSPIRWRILPALEVPAVMSDHSGMNASYLSLVVLVATSVSFADETVKREFTKNGVVYVEETTIQKNGKSVVTYPKEEKSSTTTSTDAKGNVTTRTKSVGPAGKFNISVTQSPAEIEAIGKALGPWLDAIAECRKYRTEVPHPLIPDEKSKIEVHGLVGEKCKFTQTIPGGGLQTCLFSAEQRKQIKATSGRSLQSMMNDEKTCQYSTP